ncbi:CHAT domain-containing tetratricopeptide repeat protein [Sphingobium sp. CR2-8]|uniref:CHAT domain-containing tetratricopeptide repeat protein n=1 Tax=Sphingobium sp. CR2-8 TaxID=1306534 RepID=UPI002DB6BDEF|nr:CHAT domain-containing tetratricopeptide repeat protein [Sphingobium sp. CR2-8]MEC3912305.1 CHAT domain-containing tetratricopeptide repeat protein [Sphingobium sp. CR2-8]
MHYERLYRLEKRALNLFESDDYALSMSQQTRDAWVQVQDAAMKVKVGGRPHPLAGVALINLASMDQIDGKNPDALARSSAGLTLLAPFADAYPIPWMQGLSIKGYVQTTLGDVASGANMLAAASTYMDGYIARTAADRLDPETHMLRSNIAFGHAQALSRLGRNDEAVLAQKASMDARITAVGPNSADSIGSYYGYAQMLQRAGKDTEAERYARLAVDKATDHIDRKHPSYARALEALGLLLSRTGRRAESLDYLQRAIAIKRETVGTDSLYFQFGLQNLASVLMPLERYAYAEALFMEAEEGFRKIEGENSPQSARALAYAASANVALGQRAKAITRFTTALTRVGIGSDGDQDIGQRVYPYLVPALIKAGRIAESRKGAIAYAAITRQLDNAPALPLAKAAVLLAWTGADNAALGENARRLAGVLRDGAAMNGHGELTEEQRAGLDLVLAAAVQTQDGALALDAMAVLTGSRIAQANRLVAQRLVEDPVLAERVRRLQDSVKVLEVADKRLLKALATDQGVAAARAARAQIAITVEAERVAMARDYPRWVDAHGGERPDLRRLQSALGPQEALLAVIPAFDGVYLLAINAHSARVEQVAIGRAAMVAMIQRLRSSLTPKGFDQAAAQDIYRQIFTPAILATLGKARTLKIVPTGAFASLPFALLPQRPIDAIDRDTPWLIKRFAIEIQPSFAIDAGKRRQMGSRDGRFLGIGAPQALAKAHPNAAPDAADAWLVAANHHFRSGQPDVNAWSQLPDLPGSLAELQAVAKRFGPDHATLLIGADANERAIRTRDLSPYNVILFATHGLVNGEMEGVTEPALVLSPSEGGGKDADGLLTASDIALMRMDADWVILSACNTAAGGDAQAAAYSGLAQAFRYAGAGSLLVSHWPVRDDASAFVTLETVKGASRGLPRAVALQRAMLKLMESKRPGAAQPYIWAPFILIGR